ncbi:MAG: hypothetical protein R3F23_01180 [Verrucomicrobiia bacterium]
MKFKVMGLLLFGISLANFSHADRYAKSYTLDFPYRGDRNIPRWLSVVKEPKSPRYLTSQSFGIRPQANADTDLVITIFFNEGSGGFLRVFWEGLNNNTEMLAPNLYDNIGMPNQKTLLIRRSTLSSPGKLVFQTTESTMNIRRIHWEWVKSQTIPMSHDLSLGVAYVDGFGRSYSDAEVYQFETGTTGDFWRSSIVNAMLIEKAERIEEGAALDFEIQSPADIARLETQIAGLAPEEKIGVWLNRRYLGEMATQVPDLADPGYQRDEAGDLTYIGWRRGSFFFPPDQLIVGENQLQLVRWANSPLKISQPLAIKNTILQIKYKVATSNPATMPTTTQPIQAPTTKPTAPSFQINPQLTR